MGHHAELEDRTSRTITIARNFFALIERMIFLKTLLPVPAGRLSLRAASGVNQVRVRVRVDC